MAFQVSQLLPEPFDELVVRGDLPRPLISS